MKMSRVCSGMLSSENGEFKFLKTAKTHKMHMHHIYHIKGSCNCFISPKQFVGDQKHERNSSQRAVSYIFQNIESSILVTFD